MRTRFLLTAVLAGMIAAPPAVWAQAQVAPGINNTGPGGGVWGIMQRYADVMRVRSQAYMPTIREADSSLAISCFDRSLALASRLGAIFSDVPAQRIQPPNLAVFGGAAGSGVYNIHAGIGVDNQARPNTLLNAYVGGMANQLDVYYGGIGALDVGDKWNTLPGMQVVGDYVEAPEITPSDASGPDDYITDLEESSMEDFFGHRMNFSRSLSTGISATQVTFLMRFAEVIGLYLTDPAATPNLTAQIALQNPTAGSVAQVTTEVTDALGVLASFFQPGMTPVDILRTEQMRYYDQLAEARTAKDQVYAELNDAGGLAMTFIDDYLDFEDGYLYGPDTALTGLPWTDVRETFETVPVINSIGTVIGNEDRPNPVYSGSTGCRTFAQLWRGISRDGLVMEGVKNTGPKGDLPYFIYSNLVRGTPKGSGQELNSVLAGKQGVLRRAQQDLVSSLWAPDGAPELPYQTQLYGEIDTAADPDVPVIPSNSLRSWRPTPNVALDETAAPESHINRLLGIAQTPIP